MKSIDQIQSESIGSVFSIEDFLKLRTDGSIIPSDGTGHPHNGEIELDDIDVFDITIRDIYKYPYVCWYNK